MLGATANQKKFKGPMLDIGLLQRLCQVPVELELKQENLLAMYRGKLAEQFVAQELLAWHSSELFYWARDARGSNDTHPIFLQLYNTYDIFKNYFFRRKRSHYMGR